MKDRQVEQLPAQFRIPFVSAFLHCVSMTALVYLRSRFGYAYLRPRSVFFAFSWAFTLFLIYAWTEAEVWRKAWPVCLYGTTTVALYWAHLATAFVSEVKSRAKHDNESGTPHFHQLVKRLGKDVTQRMAINLQIWGEPLLILLAGLLLRWPVGEKYLSAWLIIVAPCLCAKECFNFWFLIRHKKRRKDSIEDAEDMFDHTATQPELTSGVAVRKDKVKRTRSSEQPS